MARNAFAAVLGAGSLALATMAGAQAPLTPGTLAPETTTGQAEKEMMGTVQSIDDDKLVLEDGTEFRLAPAAGIDRAEVDEGAQVLVSYRDDGGEKVATSVKLGS